MMGPTMRPCPQRQGRHGHHGSADALDEAHEDARVDLGHEAEDEGRRRHAEQPAQADGVPPKALPDKGDEPGHPSSRPPQRLSFVAKKKPSTLQSDAQMGQKIIVAKVLPAKSADTWNVDACQCSSACCARNGPVTLKIKFSTVAKHDA
eukprot:scaffold2012_cov228-Pinguiococcus_pyrenoidosus.AAC.7